MSAAVSHEQLFRRLVTSIGLFFAVFMIGALGFWIIGQSYGIKPEVVVGHSDPTSFLNALYMSAITITTVGYGEATNFHILDGNGELVGEIYTTCYVLFAYLTVVYASANIVAALVEGAIGKEFQRRKMEKRLAALSNHYVVCGAGTTGHHIIEELIRTGNEVVVIDRADEILDEWADAEHCYPLVGDATDDELLETAGIDRCIGVFPCLHDDKDNVFIALTARQRNKECRIVGRATDVANKSKLLLVGANAVISPNHIGGLRMASEMIRPSVVSFLDTMLRQQKASMRFEEVPIAAEDEACGHMLRDLQTGKAVGLNVIGIMRENGEIQYNPVGDTVVNAGDSLIVISDASRLERLKRHTKTGVKRFTQRISKERVEAAMQAANRDENPTTKIDRS